jgi:predicted phosphodiesterase
MQSNKLRIICISDTHNHTPHLPAGDVLIHAGDISNRGTPTELTRQLAWLTGPLAPFSERIIVAGNHDLALDASFCAQNAQQGARKWAEAGQAEAARQRQLLRESNDITYLEHEGVQIKLLGEDVGVFGSPWSRRIIGQEGRWVFGYADGEEAEARWASLGALEKGKINVLVVHGPPKGLMVDLDREGGSDGCEALRWAIGRVRPRLVVCGHRHEGRGCVVVEWDGELGHRVRRVWKWVDPGAGNAKVSLVDLTGKKGRWLLIENGESRLKREGDNDEASSLDIEEPHGELEDTHAVFGLLRDPKSRWTCIVNAAIMAHSHGGPKEFNKPIGIDIEIATLKDS